MFKAEGFANVGDDCARDELEYRALLFGRWWELLGLVKDESGDAGAGQGSTDSGCRGLGPVFFVAPGSGREIEPVGH